MPTISKIKDKTNNIIYDIADTDAREDISDLKSDLNEKASVSASGDYVFLDTESGGAAQRYSVPSQSAFDDLKEQVESGSGDGLTSAIKSALLQLAQKVAYIDDDGQTYYNDLYDALYPTIVYTSITLNKSSLSFGSLNTTQTLVATTTPRGGDVTWSSSNTSVATVSQTGVVTSVGYGNATITATCGSLTATCSVAITQATVTSISANYTQSGTVYEYTSLDDLKNDLVVTASWSNGSTSTVAKADYTLSGTLTAGTSTVTVSYGGKTTTFNVTVTSAPNWSISNSLTNVSNSNNATQITHGSPYSATLTPSTGYYIASITITMGGTDVTSLYYADGSINIGSVTGNVTITAVGQLEPETGLVYSNSEPIVTNGSTLVDTGFAPNDGAFTIMCEWSGASFSNNGLLFSLFQNVNANTPVVGVSMGYPATTYGLISYNFRNDASDINTTTLRVVVTKSAGSSNPRWYYKDTNGELVTKSQSNIAVTPTGNIYIGGKVTSADGSSASNYVRATFNTFKCYNVVCNENKIKGFLEVE